MLNIEKYKNEIEDIGIGSLAVNDKGELKRCASISCFSCAFYPKESCCDINKTEWLCEEYKEPEINWDEDIDWMKVPVDTEVLVGDDEEILFTRKFAICTPNASYKYRTFDKGREHNDAFDIIGWKCCKLANPEDIEKYRKR